MTEAWWPAQHDGTIEPKESKYPEIDFLDNEDTAPAFNAHVDADMDGDGVLDGADDNDHDGLTNQFEVRRPATGSHLRHDEPLGIHQPVQPLQALQLGALPRHPPFNHYQGDNVPPIGPNPPAGYPDVHPVTPNG